jgi:hypothetical protein
MATISGHLWRKPRKLAAKADFVRLNIVRERRPRCSLIVMAPDSMGGESTQPGGLRRDAPLSHPRRQVGNRDAKPVTIEVRDHPQLLAAPWDPP